MAIRWHLYPSQDMQKSFDVDMMVTHIESLEKAFALWSSFKQEQIEMAMKDIVEKRGWESDLEKSRHRRGQTSAWDVIGIQQGLSAAP